MDLRRIKGKPFTVRFLRVMELLDIKTIHSAKKFLDSCEGDYIKVKWIRANVHKLREDLNELYNQNEDNRDEPFCKNPEASTLVAKVG